MHFSFALKFSAFTERTRIQLAKIMHISLKYIPETLCGSSQNFSFSLDRQRESSFLTYSQDLFHL